MKKKKNNHKDKKQDFTRVNDSIRLSPLMVIGPDGEKLGIITNDEAKAKAREYELDLVEVAPNVRPPVCRIMDYGKFKFEQGVKEKKQKANSKASQQKEIRFRPSIGDADIETKVRKIKEFLEDGNKVMLRLQFKARENAHKDRGFEVVDKVLEQVAGLGKPQNKPKVEGKFLTCLLEPEK